MVIVMRKPVFLMLQPAYAQTSQFTCTDPEGGGQGVLTPHYLKNHKNIGFLSKTGPDLLKNHKATKLAFNVGPSSARLRNPISMAYAGPRSAVGNLSGYRCVSDCRSRGREFDPGPAPYFRGD